MKNKPIRGFAALVGQIIKKVDATCINMVSFECESGDIVHMCADELTEFGMPIITCVKQEK